MQIKQITATSVRIPYAAPAGPYIGRRSVGGHGTLGAAGLIVKIETDTGIIGWGAGTGRFETDPNIILAAHRVANIEGALAAMEQAGIGRGPMSLVA